MNCQGAPVSEEAGVYFMGKKPVYPINTSSPGAQPGGLFCAYATDRFSATRCEKAGESLFMSIDELCSPVKPQHICENKTERNAPKAEAMEKLVKELIGDRLLELSRYVVMDTINKTMIIDKTALIDAGYTLVTH